MCLTPLCPILHESKVVLVFAQWLFIFWQTDIRQRSHYFFWLLAPPNSPHFSLFSYFNTQIMKSWRDLSTLFYTFPLCIRCLMVSTDQSDPSCFYFRISWILMERHWFYFFLSPPFSAGPQKPRTSTASKIKCEKFWPKI